MNFYKRRKILRNISAPDLIPVRIRGHEIEEGKVVILLPKFESKIYHAFSPRLQKLFFRIILDELGSDTWEAIDGERTVQEISNFIREKSSYGSANLDELDDRLSKFISSLYERRFISFRQIFGKGRGDFVMTEPATLRQAQGGASNPEKYKIFDFINFSRILEFLKKRSF